MNDNWIEEKAAELTSIANPLRLKKCIAAALREAENRGLEKAAEEENPYPEQCFLPLSDAEVEVINAAILSTGIRHPIDRYNAQFGRVVWDNRTKLIEALKTGEGR